MATLKAADGLQTQSHHDSTVATRRVPVEVWDKVLGQLKTQDIKSLRISSKIWSEIGIKFLFAPFTFRLDRYDIERFERLWQFPRLFDHIHSLRFESGFVGIRDIAEEVGELLHLLVNDSERARKAGKEESRQSAIKKLFKEAMPEYAEWNTRVFKASQNYSHQTRMCSILKKMQRLDRIDISRRDTCFQNRDLLNFWLGGTEEPGNFHVRAAIEEFTVLLRILQETPHQIRHLTHDHLPVRFFTDSPLHDKTKSLQQLRTLHLTFDAGMAPRTAFWKRLGVFLRDLPSLVELKLSFTPFDLPPISDGKWHHSDNKEEIAAWYVPLWKILGEHVWKYLEVLELHSMLLCEVGLFNLLSRHSNTLRSLHFSDLALWEGSFRNIFSRISDFEHLKSFRLSGIIESLHTENDWWLFIGYPSYGNLRESWASFLRSYEEDYPTKDRAEALRAFEIDNPKDFLSHGTWQPSPKTSWTRVHSSSCTDCMSNIAISELASWRDDLSVNSDSIGEIREEGFVPNDGNGGDEKLLIYNSAGFDEDGYDKYGRNNGGVHYEEVIERDRDGNPCITRYTAYRRALDRLVECIPRLRKLELEKPSPAEILGDSTSLRKRKLDVAFYE